MVCGEDGSVAHAMGRAAARVAGRAGAAGRVRRARERGAGAAVALDPSRT